MVRQPGDGDFVNELYHYESRLVIGWQVNQPIYRFEGGIRAFVNVLVIVRT
jgi:hypothetical protein